jgi:hypothetical protein
MSNEYKNIETAVDTLLNLKSYVRRKKRNEQDKKREIFVQIINGIEEVIIRSNIAMVDYGIDYSKYDDSFLMVIDALIYMNFGKDAAELISFYIWDRVNPDGSINPVLDEEENEIVLKDANQLWDLILKVNPKL